MKRLPRKVLYFINKIFKSCSSNQSMFVHRYVYVDYALYRMCTVYSLIKKDGNNSVKYVLAIKDSMILHRIVVITQYLDKTHGIDVRVGVLCVECAKRIIEILTLYLGIKCTYYF